MSYGTVYGCQYEYWMHWVIPQLQGFCGGYL